MGDSSDKNDKTQLLSDSQVLEVKPSPAKTPVVAKNDRSVWKGVVVGADEFAMPTAPRSSTGRWVVLGIFAAAALGAGGYLWWTRVRSPAVMPDAAAKAADAMPQDAAPGAVPSAALDAASDVTSDAAMAAPPDAAAIDAGVDAGVKPIKRKPPKHLPKRKVR